MTVSMDYQVARVAQESLVWGVFLVLKVEKVNEELQERMVSLVSQVHMVLLASLA